MSVRVDGCLEFQMWYYENYGDVSGIVSDEIYSEYRDWKRERPSFFTRLIDFIIGGKKMNIKYYYEVWFYQENGFASTHYRVKSFLNKKNAEAYAQKMNKQDNSGLYEVYKKEFADGDISD